MPKRSRSGHGPSKVAPGRAVMDVLASGRSILALEKRIAFDGAAAATAARTVRLAGGVSDHHAGVPDTVERQVVAHDVAARELAAHDLTAASVGTFEHPASRDAARAAPTSVVFIESDVPDIATLIKDVDHSAQIVLLDAGKDGVDAIASYLAAHHGVQDVHIFSHGSEGNLSLGTADLDAATMVGRYAADLATIKASLGPDANILVYGCDFALNADGNSAAHLLASLTGANVAASTDLTGGTAEGGDFVLEDRIGAVNAPDVLSATIASDYDGLLASPTTIFANSGTGLYHANLEFLTYANTTLATGGITNGATATYTTANGSTVTATFSNVSNAADEATFKPAAFSAYKPSKFYTGYNNTASTSEMLYGGYNGTSSFTVTFTATDKNGNSYTPNIAFADSEVTDANNESYKVTTNGGAFQNVETVGATGYTLTGVGTQTFTLSNTVAGVPVLVTTGATALNIAVQISTGKEGFALALVEPTLTLDANNSSGSTGDNYVTTFTEKGAGVAIADTDTTAVEPGVTNAASAQVVLTNAQAGDLLSVGTLPSGITGSIDTSVAGQVTVNLTGGASLASYESAIQAISFSNTSSNPSTVDRTIDVTFNDGNQNSNTAVTTVHVVAVNDPPVESVPGAQTTNKDTALSVSGLSVSDVDANGGTETTTLSVADGTISLASTTGLTFSNGTGTNDTSETFTGTLSAIDNAIATVTYQPKTGFTGSDTLSFATDDNGNTGTGGAKTTTATLGITVNNVNPSANGTIANQKVVDGQSGVSIATSQAFSDSLGLALTYGATGLPAGLAINATTGAITGTIDHDASRNAPTTTGSGATLDGKYTVVETASDGQGGSTTQTFTIDATNQAPAVGTRTANQSNSDGATITAVNAAAAFSDPNGDPLTYTASGLPAGLTISSAGVISGTVAKNAAPGTDTVTVTATDDKGAATSETFSWVVKDVPPTTNGTLPNKAYTDGQSGVSIATSQGFTDGNGNALTYSATGLPAGLTINATTGAITGTIDHDASKNAPTMTGNGATLDGKYTVTVTANDGLGGTSAQTFTVDTTNQAPVVGTGTANQSNNDGDTVTAVNAASAFSDPNGDPLTYTATGLPAGLTISAAGVISGTVAKNAAPGTDTVTVTATDDKGAATSETFSWVVKDVPPTTNGTLPNKAYTDGQANVSIATGQAFADGNGNALTYTATGLPAGLTINATTGAITGTIDHDASKNAPTTAGSGATLDGTYTVVVTASDGLGGAATQTFTIDSTNQAPAVGTRTANQSNSDGATITAVNAATAFADPNGDPLTYAATGLPAGLTISSAGVISGTVAKNAAPGTDTVTVTATDDKGAATSETFSWVVKDVPPTASGTLANQVTTDGQAGVSIATSQGFADRLNNTLTYSASGLPAGLTIDAATGKITGTLDHDASKNAPTTAGLGATLDGTYTVVVTASDGLGGTATQSFTIDATNQAPSLGTRTGNQANSDGDTIAPLNAANAFSDPNGDPLTYAATGLPAGLTISSAGVISGTVAKNAAPGTDTVTVTATDDKGAATSETFDWVVKDVPPAANGTLSNQRVADGQAGVSIATSQGFTDGNGNALTYTATGLPAGLTIDATTGAIAGTIDHDASKTAPVTTGSGATLDGTYTVTVTASDGLGGAATQSFTIDATNQAPVVGTATANQSNSDGATITAVNAAAAFTDPNGDPLTYTATGLPAGLTISAAGVISGTVATNAPPGTDTVTVTATDDKGAATSETFDWVVKAVPPTNNGTLPDQVTIDGQAGISIATAQGFTDSSGSALTYTATGLPAGLTIDATTGTITGTVDHDASKNAPTTTGSGATLDGTYTVAVTATDAYGSTATQRFTIDSTNQAPNVGTPTPNQASNEGQAIAPLATAGVFSDPNTGDVLTYGAQNLPAGLTIDATTGAISGTVAANAAPGTYAVRIIATDDKGAASREGFTWSVRDVPPTATGTLSNDTYADATGGISIATAGGFASPNGLPLTYAAQGLPSGLAIDPATGIITGQLDHDASRNAPATTGAGATLDGTYTVAITASDGQGGTATRSFTIDATNTAPAVVTATPDQHSADGNAATLDAAAAFRDPNTGDTLSYTATGLPTGLTINAATGLISGTIDKGASRTGPYTVTVTATDDKGAATSETFTWAVDDVAPTATPPLADRSVADGASLTAGTAIPTANGFTNPNGLPLTYSATGLPSGLAIDPGTGVISGTLNHDASAMAANGAYTVAVTVDDGQGGTATNTFRLTASNQAPVVVAPTADQAASDGASVPPVEAGQAFADPNGDPLSFAASGLPAGLAIDPATGRITGTIAANAAPGAYAVTVLATDDKGAATPETFTWTITDTSPTVSGGVAGVSAADGQAGLSIATAGGFGNPNGLPLTYTATGLPAGLAINARTGLITGTLDHDASADAPVTTGAGATLEGTYAITVTASDGQGGSASQGFTLDATNQAPVIGLNTADQHGTAGNAASLNAGIAFTDPNSGDVLTYTAGNLPAGLTIDPATGLISGTLAANAASVTPYPVTVTATDDKGAATTERFTWVVDPLQPTAAAPIPDVATIDGATVSLDTASHFDNPDNATLTYAATGLPAGLAIDPGTGVISGTLDHDASAGAPAITGSGATLDGTYAITVTASDGQGGSASQTFALDSANRAPVVVARTADQAGATGQATAALDVAQAFSDPNGDPLTFTASGLPAGLSIDPATGRITGTIAADASGPYAVTVVATDDKGAATSETFAYVVADTPPVASGTLANQTDADSSAGISIATASGFTSPNGLPLTYAASGLPRGLTIDPTSGLITGTLDHDASADAPVTTGTGATLDGTYTVTVTASDGQGGTASRSFTIDATNTAPVVRAATPDQHSYDGNAATLDASAAFADPNTGDTLRYAATGLPAGLTINAATGLISGTIDARASASGPTTVTVTATDDKGAATSETFAWSVDDVAPVATPALPDQAVADGASVTLPTATGFTDPNGLPLTFTATGLPTGLAIDPATGVISGTLDHDASINAPGGAYTVAVTASDGQGGAATNSFHLTATNQAPVVGTPTASQASTDGEGVAPVDASRAFSDPNGDPLTFAASNLPRGLAIDPATGLITGTIAAGATPGSQVVTVTATDDKGAVASETFSWSVDDVPPAVTGTLAGRVYADGTNGVAIDTAGGFASPNGLPLTYGATGLPRGLTIDPATGIISGFINHEASRNAPVSTGAGATLAGTYTIIVTASDGQGGLARQVFTIESTNQAPTLGARTADQRDVDGASVSLAASTAFADPNLGDTLTFSATGLPAGLTIDPATGLITGTIDARASASGPYAVTVTATDDKGAATGETFAWSVADVPPTAGAPVATASAPDGTTITPIDTASHFGSPIGLPLSFTATGLPAGLSIDHATGLITGTLDHDASVNAPATTGAGATLDGAYTIAVTASDGQGGVATQTFALDATNQAPVVVAGTPDQHAADGGTVGLATAPAFSDPNGDPLTFTASGLPAGLSIDPATGRITGTIAADASGPYAVTVVATDDKGAATSETFAYVVADTPPVASGTLANQTDADSSAGISIATASGFTSPNGLPLTYAASGLPRGLTIDPTSGLITGTLDHDASADAPVTTGTGATLDGTYTVTVTASDGQGGTASRSFTIDATNTAPVVRAATPDQHSYDGNAATLDASAAFADPNTGDTLRYAATGLPAGLTINAATGLISGTIDARASASGPTTVTVTATDDKGAATSETFAWSVDDVAPVATPALPDQAVADGASVTLPTATGFTDPNGLPLTFTATGLPTGLAIDPATGVISGTLDHDASRDAPTTTGSGATLDGTYTITVTASDGQGGVATQAFTLDATNEAPAVVARTPDQRSTDGAAVSLDTAPAFADPNGDPLTYAATGLPRGLAIDPATGAITGTIDPRASIYGPFAVTVTATDDKGAAASETFVWRVDEVPPSAGAPVAATSAPDGTAIAPIDAGSHFADPDGLPLAFTASGLPAGLSIDPATGIITGTLDHDASRDAPTTSGAGATLDGRYTVTVTASDGQGGIATEVFTFDATNGAPVVAAGTPDQRSADGAAVSLDAGGAFADPNGDPLRFAASGLPAGLSIDAGTGVITGTIDPRASAQGPYAVTITATDDKGAATSETFAWHVRDVPPTAGEAIPSAEANDGAALPPIDAAAHFTDANGLPLRYAATGLPTGLSIDPATGVISGTLAPDASGGAPGGTYAVAVTASDGQGGVAHQDLTITAVAVPAVERPVTIVGQVPDQAGLAGQAIAPLGTASAFSDPDGGPLTYAATGLPPGLAIDPATGSIAGTIGAVAPTTYRVTVTATDGAGASASETFAFSVERPSAPRQPPVLPLASLVTADAFIPLATALLDTAQQAALDAFFEGGHEPGHDLPAPDATPVLDAINLISGDQEQSVVIRTERIVVSTVENVWPLDRLQDLATPGAGIVRSGAGTNERGDRFERARAGFDRDLDPLYAPGIALNASSLDGGEARSGDGTAINVETLLRDRVLTITLDNRSATACVVPVAGYDVTLADGSPLPAWLRADRRGVVSGKVPVGVDEVDLRITATLRDGAVSQRTVTVRTHGGVIRTEGGAIRTEGGAIRTEGGAIHARPAPTHRAGRSLADMIAAARPEDGAGRGGLARFLD